MNHLLITTYNKYRWRRSGAVSPVVFALMLASSALFRVSAGVFPDRAGITPHPQDRSGENKDARIPSGTGRFSFPEAKPEHVGMNEAKLREARAYALQGGGSGCILRSGRLVMTWGDQQCRYDIFSSTKSIGVTALGLATMDGKVSLRDPAKRYLPAVGLPPESNAQSGWLDDLTLWHLATACVNRPTTATRVLWWACC